MVFLPVLMVPMLYISMYRPSLSRTFSASQNMTLERLCGYILSIIGPLLCSCVLAEHTFDAYFKDMYAAAQSLAAKVGTAVVGDERRASQGRESNSLMMSRVLLGSTVYGLEAFKLAGTMLAFLCIESNSVFFDLRDHSGLDRRKSSMVMASIGILVGMVIVQHRRARTAAAGTGSSSRDELDTLREGATFTGGLTVDDNRSLGNKLHSGVLKLLNGPFIPRTLTTLASSGAACLVAVLLRMPYRSYPLITMSVLGLAEYYQRWRHIDTAKITLRNAMKGWAMYFLIQVIVMTSALSLALCAYTFCEETLLHLDFVFCGGRIQIYLLVNSSVPHQLSTTTWRTRMCIIEAENLHL